MPSVPHTSPAVCISPATTARHGSEEGRKEEAEPSDDFNLGLQATTTDAEWREMRNSHPSCPNCSFLSHINIAAIFHAIGESVAQKASKGLVDGGATTFCPLELLSEKSEPQCNPCTTGFSIAMFPPICSDATSAPPINE